MDKVIIIGVTAAIAVGTALYFLLTTEKEKPHRSRPGRGSSSHPPNRSPPTSYSDLRPDTSGNRKSFDKKPGQTSKPDVASERNKKLREKTKARVSSEPCEKFKKETETPVSSEPCEKFKRETEAPSFADSNLVPIELEGKSETHVSSDPNPAILSKIRNDSQSCQESNKSKPDKKPGQTSKLDAFSEPSEELITHSIFPDSATSLDVCSVCDKPANATLYPCMHHELCCEHAQYYFDIAKNLRQKARCPAPDCRTVLEYFIV